MDNDKKKVDKEDAIRFLEMLARIEEQQHKELLELYGNEETAEAMGYMIESGFPVDPWTGEPLGW